MINKLTILFLCVCMVIGGKCTAEVQKFDNSTDILKKTVYEYSLAQAYKLAEAMTEPSLLESAVDSELDNAMISLLKDIDYSNPRYMILILPNAQFNAASVLKQNGISEDMLGSVCFDLVFDTNNVLSDGSFATWSSRTRLFDVIKEPLFPTIAYTIFVYSKEGPQVVVAYSRLKEDIILIQTALAYNTSLFPDEIYMALPYCIDTFWGNMDTTIYSME